MARRRLLWKLYATHLLVILVCIIGLGAFALRSFRTFYLEQTASRLEATARLVGQDLIGRDRLFDPSRVDALSKTYGRSAAMRITVILPDGKILGDSESDPIHMENHAGRSEVRAALEGEVARAVRHSTTLELDMMYLAIPLDSDGRTVAVVRTAVPLRPIREALEGVYLHVAVGALVLALLVAGVGWWASSRISRPLKEMMTGAERFARGELGHRIRASDTEELGRLADSLNRMAAQLRGEIQTVTRQRNEQEAILTSMTEGVVAIDAEGRILRLNQAAGDLLNADPESCVGRPLVEIIRNVDLGVIVRRILSSGETIEEEISLRQGEEEQHFQVRGTTLWNAEGQRMGALLVINDVTRLYHLEDVRRTFVANVSHELKTPITSIHGFIETLRDGAIRDPKKADRFLEIIQRQSSRLNAIIDDLLQLSRIESKDQIDKIQRVSSNLKSILESAVTDCSALAGKQGVAVEVECPDALSITVNPRMIEQAVSNLLDNAIKYSEAGESVRLLARQVGEAVVIHVRDQGPGIAAEHLPRVFERFYRVDRARSRDLGGTGLGLAIVKHIAQIHGGSVSVESKPGRGSTFSIHLPFP